MKRPNTVRSWQCRLGLHRWKETGNRTRECRKCGQKQTLYFYSNRTQEWEDDEPTQERSTA